jgi:hypothetical protein
MNGPAKRRRSLQGFITKYFLNDSFAFTDEKIVTPVVGLHNLNGLSEGRRPA